MFCPREQLQDLRELHKSGFNGQEIIMEMADRRQIATFVFLFRALKIFFMNYWLVKSEPGVYSWDRLEKEKKAVWDGVRSYAGRLHLRNMKKGDQVLFYHSNEGTDIVGIAKVAKEAYQDPTTDDELWVAVDIEAFKKLKKPVSLETIKKTKGLADMALVRINQLSVQPVKSEEWKIIMGLAGDK
jgi:predicted RNA-binding protein with PUA-like domain